MENIKKKHEALRYMGRVTNWNRERGFGFVRCFEDGESYYCNKKVINGEPYLIRNSIVDFCIGYSKDRQGNPTTYLYNVLVAEVPEERHTKY